MEALAIRYCDLDYSVSPIKVKVRKEFAKNRVSREVYISDEKQFAFPSSRLLRILYRYSKVWIALFILMPAGLTDKKG
jgi:hypothetical protein